METTTVWYWQEFDELILMSNVAIVDFDHNEIEEQFHPRMSLSGCIYIGEFK